jgi:DNA adenine methylase
MIETPFNFTGSKFKLLGQLLPEFDYSKSNFFDVFCGGGSVYTNVSDKYDTILVNDIIKDLIGIHQELIESDKIIERTKLICPEKTDESAFLKLREDYNNQNSPDKLWALMLSCTSNMMRFNQKFKFNQTFGKRSWNSSTENKVKIFTEHIRQYRNKIIFYSKSFNELEIKKNTMYYCDPPYSNTEAGYNAYWKKDDDKKLYDYLINIDKIGSSFMISGTLEHNGNVCKILEDLISDGFNYKELKFDYNKVSRVGKKETVEIIVKNY